MEPLGKGSPRGGEESTPARGGSREDEPGLHAMGDDMFVPVFRLGRKTLCYHQVNLQSLIAGILNNTSVLQHACLVFNNVGCYTPV